MTTTSARTPAVALALGLVSALALAACGGKTGVYKQDYAGPLSLTLVNQSPRPIEAIYIFPLGSASRGTSWTTLAPGATQTVKIQKGNFELVAVSAKRRIDAKFSETPEATTSLELRGDQALVFHDAGATPAGLDAPGTLGVTFMISAPEPAPEPGDPAAEPGVEAGSDAM